MKFPFLDRFDRSFLSEAADGELRRQKMAQLKMAREIQSWVYLPIFIGVTVLGIYSGNLAVLVIVLIPLFQFQETQNQIRLLQLAELMSSRK